MLKNYVQFLSVSPVTVLVASMAMAPAVVNACGSDPFIGQICTFVFDYCPDGFVEANGQLLPVNANQALFSLLSNRYGGNGSTNFAVPDLRNRAPTGKGTSPDFPQITTQTGTKYGAPSTVLTINKMPAHNHAAQFIPTTGSQTINIPATPSSLSIVAGLPVSTVVGTTSGTVSALGNGQTGYLAGVSGKAGSFVVNFTGPYTTTQPSTGNLATLPANITVSGLAATAATSAAISTVTGGSVAIGSTGGASSSNAVSTISPSLAVTYCIATMGIYPVRP